MIAAIHESKAISLIIRRTPNRFQLLAYRATDSGRLFFRLPGGGVNISENPKDAAVRETLEETGIPGNDLVFMRPVGELRYYKPLIHKQVVRIDLLFLYSGALPATFRHIVTGDGKDHGHAYDYCWISKNELNQVHPELRQLLNPYNLPELFFSPSNLGLQRNRLRISHHQPEWLRIYEFEEMEIRSIIADQVQVHHVGSTSIPDLTAKPIIDILVGYHLGFDSKTFIAALTRIGYTFRGENGIPNRMYFTKGTAEFTYFHLHAFPIADPNYTSHLKVRDTLKQNIELRREYDKYKRCHIHLSREEYTNGKAELISRIIAA